MRDSQRLQKLGTLLAWLVVAAGCVGVLCLAVVRGNVSAIFISALSVFIIGLVSVVRASHRNI